jgi:hypothetical protein
VNVDPFATLGLSDDASAEDVRAARRELAKHHHPDRGGDAASMRTVNEAADAALARIAGRRPEPASPDTGRDRPTPTPTPTPGADERLGGRVARDMPSFTVEALPVETFEGLLVVASWIGEVLDDDPPYRLEVHLREPTDCWCRLEIVPDAGASTVSLTVAGLDAAPAPDIIAVRDLWVEQLNRVDWT